jgi:hypothetical protein
MIRQNEWAVHGYSDEAGLGSFWAVRLLICRLVLSQRELALVGLVVA